MSRVVPFGAWPSPISASMVAADAVGLAEPWIADGVVYWLEGRPEDGGRQVLMAGDAFSPAREVVGAPFNVRTMVHEYGGGAYCLHGRTVVFSNLDDHRLWIGDLGGSEPRPLTPDSGGRHRFADGRITPDGLTWIGVRERHDDGDRPDQVVNELVAVSLVGDPAPRVIAAGRDFYSNPRPSPDGTRLCFLAWDLPAMPWDGCELSVAELGPDAELGLAEVVAGRQGEESIWQPEWSPTGDLVFASDRSGWWNLERIRNAERTVLHPAEAEFGGPAWVFGERSFAFLSDGRIVLMYGSGGVQHLAILDPPTSELLDLDLPYTAVSWGPNVVAEGSAAAFIAASASIPPQVVVLDFGSRSVEVLRSSAEVELDGRLLTEPEQLEVPTDGGRSTFAHFYAPANPEADAPAGELPPLIVMSHGGPTAEATPAFDLEIRFFTSRGFAVVDVNYGGSTGFGRAYRERLNGNWGVVDTADCLAVAHWLVDRGRVDGERLMIRGGSAGGYTTLCALTFHDAFAAGMSRYGIGDLEPFATGETHKFESRYEHSLVGPWPEAADLYRARSPIHSLDLLSTPMLLLHGEDDKVVPISQSRAMAEALDAKGLPYALLTFEGEGHGFRRAETIVRALDAELTFYRRILGIEAVEPAAPLEIRHLSPS
jgi:dipeptidyl aminopeptidase/acylaminoacyl peptidase